MSTPSNNSISPSKSRQSISREDYLLIVVELEKLYNEAQAELTLLADTRGLVVASKGKEDGKSAATLSALSSADYAASEEIANMIGEDSFTLHYHRGTAKSVYIFKVIEDIILLVIAGNNTEFQKIEDLSLQSVLGIKSIFEGVKPSNEMLEI